MNKITLPDNPTWQNLTDAIRAAGFDKAAGWIESWVDEYLPEQENEPLPRGADD